MILCIILKNEQKNMGQIISNRVYEEIYLRKIRKWQALGNILS